MNPTRSSWKNQKSSRLPLTGIAALLFAAVVLLPAPGAGGNTLKVATRILPPFVIQEKGGFTGYSMDLWQNIEKELGIKSQVTVHQTVTDIFNAVRTGKSDLGIAAISITAEREDKFDFTHPIFESGLQILARSQGGQDNPVINLLSMFITPAFFQLLGAILLLILVPAHIVWLVERRKEKGLIETKSYFPGIFKACWWAAATLATQADEMPKGGPGRIVAVFWMFTAVVFVAYFTASITTSLTVQQLQGNIKGPEDLPGKKVATIKGSTSEQYLLSQHITVTGVSDIAQAYDALQNKTVDAVVFDAPVLLYYASHEGKGKVQVVGNIFRKENYGIILPDNSPHRKQINNALLKLQEKGITQQLYDKWFSTK